MLLKVRKACALVGLNRRLSKVYIKIMTTQAPEVCPIFVHTQD